MRLPTRHRRAPASVGIENIRLAFHHNVVANCKTVWIREKGNEFTYRADNCVFSGNGKLAGFGFGPAGGDDISPAEFLTMRNVKTAGLIQLEMDQSKRNYLQLAEGSLGRELKAGLFKKRRPVPFSV